MNKEIFFCNKHEFKSKYMYLRQVSCRGHRTQEPYGSAFNALSLSYPQALLNFLLDVALTTVFILDYYKDCDLTDEKRELR